ncbi:MAG: hypothetical protein K8T91_06020 [Planctomycetes bacterium]|nr:hypothetical protein [Planctomycetota bacterium]
MAGRQQEDDSHQGAGNTPAIIGQGAWSNPDMMIRSGSRTTQLLLLPTKTVYKLYDTHKVELKWRSFHR